MRLPDPGGCTGVFTSVDVPALSAEERRALPPQAPAIPPAALRRALDANYYALAYAESGTAEGESLSNFAHRARMHTRVPPAVLSTITFDDRTLGTELTTAELARLTEAVHAARAPLARRLDRMILELTPDGDEPPVTAHLDARLGLNAGAEIGFASRRILVGPELVLLARQDDELAFVLGHEIAHVVREHTWQKAFQETLMGILTGGYTWFARDRIASGILSHGTLPRVRPR